MDKSEKSTSSSSSYLNPNRLYPRPYTRSSTSRESTVSPAGSTSNLPRLSGATKRDATPSKEALTSKYKSSREDLSSSGSQNKYLNSRFLPKNSVERSYTAYTRPSNIRTNEVSRKNKELLNALHVQQERRPTPVTPEVVPVPKPTEPPPAVKPAEMETVKVCTRGTSPTLTTPTPPTFLRTRRIEFAKTIEKTVTRAKTVPENMADKEIQSDRMDDSTRSSRFAGATRISATPWTNILDMKFTSPSNKKDSADSPKSLSRTSSTKSLASVKSDKDSKKTKSKLTPPKPVDKKQLPPIPKLHSLNTPNKDFRKSVLNMNPDGSRKKLGRRSNSASSAESDNADPDATDISENLTTCTYHSKVLQTRRSPSSDISTSEEESRSRKETTISSSILGSGDELSSRQHKTLVSNSGDELSEKTSSKIAQNKTKNEAEAKNFLMRALAPVTNLFKPNKQSDSDKVSSDTGDGKVVWILDPSSEEQSQPRSAKLVLHRVETDETGWWGDDNSGEQLKSEPANMKYGGGKLWPEEPKIYSGYNAENNMTGKIRESWWLDESAPEGVQTQKPVIKHVQSGEQPWWLQDNPTEVPEGVQVYQEVQKPKIKPVESGEAPWWLNENSTPPEGVQTYPNWTEPNKPEVRRNDSGNSTWWLDSDKSNSERQPECLDTHKLRHIDSGEREWWINDDEASKDDPKPKYTIRHQESGERAWWMQDQEPLGDRASPEGLEMPKDNEDRLSPYDNVPDLREGVKNTPPLFISKHTNIDDILGGTGQLWSPIMNKIFGYKDDGDECREVDAREVIIHEGGDGGAARR